MIKIYGIDEGTAHHFFELLRIYYPSYEQGEDLAVTIHEDGDKVLVDVNFEDERFSGRFNPSDNFVDTRNEIARWMIQSLKEEGKSNSPWGILTGVRPIKFTINLLDTLGDDKKVFDELTLTYCVESKKAKELIFIAQRELELTRDLNPLGHSLYINIPFCPTRCDYCSYPTIIHFDEEQLNAYLELLKLEIDKTYRTLNVLPSSVYVGGGTPSVLSEVQLEDFLEFLQEYTSGVEFTFEAGRPDTLNRAKLEILRNFGVNRISINPQTMKQETLELIGRKHSVEDTLRIYSLARELKFNTINMDLILGLSGETEKDFMDSLRSVQALRPENITIHTLSLKNGSKLFEREGTIVRNIYDIETKINDLCLEEGYHPYYLYRQKRILGNGSNTGYSVEGHECLYNIIMMEERHSVLAMGMGSTSKIFTSDGKLKKFTNYRNLRDYTDNLDKLIEKKCKLLQVGGPNEVD